MNTTATASPDTDLMSRHQVAIMFRVTSTQVAQWARNGRIREVRDETGRPRYRRADVESLFTAGRPGRLCGGPDHPDWPLPPRH